MTPPRPAYQQGDIVVVDFPFTDVSQTKRRPALILSNTTINQTGDYLLVMITSQVKYDGLSIPITAADYVGAPLPLSSFVRFYKVFLLNESLILHKFSAVSPSFRQLISAELGKLLQ
ncbi:mRNA-degrading endonuclease toxin of MazEF toxin-antitoxin module [Spirosoma lacussanchae]|uniref:type II toxin-antitoxin system PemK/MazF family toxin n=1 Tax=Spirosoma lacussanchae TaxID=1884249 RepID=UPI0011088F84|nr:type II toxin-antitoxin system PemK/MazF family toxin [Spirosoma lacussanchae]